MSKTKEDLEFLKELQNEIKNQNTDFQSSPRFWVVMDYKNEPCWEGHADYYEVVSSELDMYGVVNNFKDDLDKNGYLDELDDSIIEELKDINDEDILVDWLNEHLNVDACTVPMHEVAEIRPDTFFITKRECQEHIKRNKHHYSSKAHSYAMTAWRSPQVEKLWEVLETLDIDGLLQ